jgi:hypothetical protein
LISGKQKLDKPVAAYPNFPRFHVGHWAGPPTVPRDPPPGKPLLHETVLIVCQTHCPGILLHCCAIGGHPWLGRPLLSLRSALALKSTATYLPNFDPTLPVATIGAIAAARLSCLPTCALPRRQACGRRCPIDKSWGPSDRRDAAGPAHTHARASGKKFLRSCVRIPNPSD